MDTYGIVIKFVQAITSKSWNQTSRWCSNAKLLSFLQCLWILDDISNQNFIFMKDIIFSSYSPSKWESNMDHMHEFHWYKLIKCTRLMNNNHTLKRQQRDSYLYATLRHLKYKLWHKGCLCKKSALGCRNVSNAYS